MAERPVGEKVGSAVVEIPSWGNHLVPQEGIPVTKRKGYVVTDVSVDIQLVDDVRAF
jgi:hypothetical protein